MSKAAKQIKRVPKAREVQPAPFVQRPAVHIAALVLLALGVYASSLANGFVSDDLLQVVGNPLIADWHRIPEMFTRSVWAFRGATQDNYYRPMHFLVYSAVYHLFGLAPWAYHLLMLLIHAGTTALVYLFARRRLSGWQGAVLAGALFAVHPIHSEAVLWIASVPDAVMTLLVLAALYAFVISRGRPNMRATAPIAAFYLGALLTKETGAMLLPILIGCELLLLRRSLRELLTNARFYATLAAVSGIYLLMRHHALGAFLPGQGHYLQMGRKELFFTACSVAGKYLYKLVLPLGLNYWHDIETLSGPSLAWLAAFTACLTIIAGIVILRYSKARPEDAVAVLDRKARVSFFLFFTVISLLPALNLNGIGATPFGERYLYLPSAGFVLLIGELWNLLLPSLSPQRRTLAWSAALLVLCASSVQIVARIPAWRDYRAMLTRAVEQSPNVAHLQEELAQLLYEQGETDAAELHYRAALRLEPNARRHNALGAILVDKQQYSEAIREFRSAIALDPSLAVAHANLGTVLRRTGQSTLASAEYNEALRLDAASVQALSGLGEIEFRQNHAERAIMLYRRAIQADESYPGGHINLGFALVRQQQYQEAATELRRALELAPPQAALVDIHFNLGLAYRGLNLAEPAVREFQTVLRLRPDYEPARQHLLDIQQIIKSALSNPAPRPAAAR